MGRRRWLAGIAAVAACALAPPMRAATAELRILVPFPRHGASDLMARAFAVSLARELGASVVVDNVAGLEAARDALKASPEGTALLLGSTGSIIVDPLTKARGTVDALAGLAPVSLLGSAAPLLTAHPSLPVERLDELVAYLRAHPDEVAFASPGTGTVPHIAGLLFAKRTGVKLRSVLFPSTAACLEAHVRGEPKLAFESQVIDLVRHGVLRAIAVMSNERVAALPRVPTVSEAGVPGIDTGTWLALFASPATSEAMRLDLAGHVRKAVADPQLAARAGDGFELRAGRPDQLARFVVAETERWSRYLRELALLPPRRDAETPPRSSR